ncbi:hypothetical protein FOVSG1_002328 [Fusarium oxysporum f. sp. vasinfectum]
MDSHEILGIGHSDPRWKKLLEPFCRTFDVKDTAGIADLHKASKSRFINNVAEDRPTEIFCCIYPMT